MHPLLSDPWVAAEIEAAVAPFVGRLPASEVAWMREQLAEVLASDEAAARLLRGAHPRAGDASGEVVAPVALDEPEGEDGERPASRAGSGRS